MKLVLFGLLSVSSSFSTEPPPSPRDGNIPREEAFKQRLREEKEARIQRVFDLNAHNTQQHEKSKIIARASNKNVINNNKHHKRKLVVQKD